MEALADLRAEPVHLIVVSGNAHQARAKNLRAKNLGRFEIGRDEDPGVKALARGLGGDGVGQIPGGRATDGLESEGFGLRQRHGDDAVLERERGEIDGVIFDVEAARTNARAKARGGDQRRHAHGNFGLVSFGNRQQFGVAPDIGGALGDIVAGEGGARRVKVVFHFQRREAILADRAGTIAPLAIAFPAAQRIVFAHNDLPGCAGPWRAPKKMPRSGYGGTRRNAVANDPSCPPQTGRELAPATRKNPGPVVVASSGPNPSATLHEDRSTRLLRGPTMVSMVPIIRQALTGARRTGSGRLPARCWPHGLMGASRTGSWKIAQQTLAPAPFS